MLKQIDPQKESEGDFTDWYAGLDKNSSSRESLPQVVDPDNNPRYIDWVSKDNSFEDVKLLAEFYRKEFARRKGHMLGTSANSFITMMAMQKYSIEEQRKIPTEETSNIFQDIVKNRVINFKYNLLNK